MSTIACPGCKRFVIAFEVAELRNELVMFDVDPVLVLIHAGTLVTSGCQPHVCQGLPESVDRAKYIPIGEAKVNCKHCGEETLVIHAIFSSEDGWRCDLCIKDRAQQEEKLRRPGRP